MAIKEKIFGDVAVLELRGDLMGGNETKQLREKVYSLISDEVVKVVLDLGKVKWVNSTGLGAILACHTSLSAKNGSLKLARAADKVQSLLMITQLIKVFDNFSTVDLAVASYKK